MLWCLRKIQLNVCKCTNYVAKTWKSKVRKVQTRLFIWSCCVASNKVSKMSFWMFSEWQRMSLLNSYFYSKPTVLPSATLKLRHFSRARHLIKISTCWSKESIVLRVIFLFCACCLKWWCLMCVWFLFLDGFFAQLQNVESHFCLRMIQNV